MADIMQSKKKIKTLFFLTVPYFFLSGRFTNVNDFITYKRLPNSKYLLNNMVLLIDFNHRSIIIEKNQNTCIMEKGVCRGTHNCRENHIHILFLVEILSGFVKACAVYEATSFYLTS